MTDRPDPLLAAMAAAPDDETRDRIAAAALAPLEERMRTRTTAPAGDDDCERCEGSGLDPDAYFKNGDTHTHAPCSECQPEDDETAQQRAAVVQALYDSRRAGLGGLTEAEAVAHMAAAVLAVLPAPADRAAVLREAADIAESLRQFKRATGARWAAQVSENVGIIRVADELRRLADEAQQDGAQR